MQPTANNAAIGAAAPRTRQIGREGLRANCSVSLRALLIYSYNPILPPLSLSFSGRLHSCPLCFFLNRLYKRL
ncbi:hypothetical protein ccbrp13_27500 [Ktedonobacteria bacterium brp13]|nr:hypothetical protein ccbrp13_27500 [Ktedonobacteria bacterium brp13]